MSTPWIKSLRKGYKMTPKPKQPLQREDAPPANIADPIMKRGSANQESLRGENTHCGRAIGEGPRGHEEQEG